MLEKLGAWMLKLYLGDYLELNTDQLSVGILSGQVELEDIPIKHDAFENFDLPIRVRSGRVGKISLSIPVAEMKSQPWVINISDVHVIVEPNTNTKYDEKAHKKRAQLNKTRMLEELENNWKLERQPEAPTSYYGSWWNYGSGIASNIMENLQLNLSDLHLRYESGKEGPVSNYSFGLIIKKLVAQSTDSNWVPQYVSGSKNPIVHKQIELVGLSLYWDYNTECLSTAASLKKRSLKLTHDCLLAPVSGKALVQRNTTAQPLRSQNQPRLKLELQFDNFMLSLNDKQYGGIASLLRELDYYEKRKLYRRTRPYEPVCKNCKAWWRHAIESELLVIRDKNERTSKEYLLKRARNCVSYVYLYYEHLAEKLTGQQSKLKEKIEADMDFETLKTLRMLAVAKIKDAGKWEMVPAQPNPGYLSSWVTWYTSKPSDTLHTSDGSKSLPDVESLSKATPSSSMTSLSSSDARSSHALRLTSKERATLEEELNDWVGKSEPAETRSTLNRDSVFLHLTFVLHHAKFLLRNSATGGDKSQGLVQLECHDICSAAVIRPRSKSAKFSLKLGGLYVKDLYNTDTQFPLLISPRLSVSSVSVGALSSQKLTEQSELFYFEIEKNPSHSEKDIKVHMRTQPLDVIYNEGVVGQVRQFFSPHKGLQSMSKEMSEAHLAERARKRYEQLKNKTKIDIQDTWENLLNTSTVKLSKRVGVRLDISAPQFIVPKDLLDGDTNMMVFDLGKLKVTNLDSQDEDDQPTFSLDPGGQEAQEDDLDIMDDDDFVTPPSTPPEPSESVSEKGLLSSASKEENMSGDEIYSHMYDRYRVLLADIQVLVVSRKDNWRLSTQRGLSHFHIIDKLSVNFRFERRLLLTADPEWPAIRVSAVMDRLSIHISPLKLMQLQRCIEKLTAQSDDIPHSTSQSSSAESLLTSSTGQARLAHSQSRSFAPLETRSVLDNSKVVKCNLDINQMSLDIHNKERCLVELQVAGVQTEFTKLPSETDLSLTVHSFIVADAIQSYGSDFELLVASHKNVRLDSQSGSMCSSMLTSPTSPRSPPSPRSPSSPEPEHVHSSARRQTSYTSFQNAVLSGIQNLLPVASATPIAEHSTGLKAHSVSSADNQAASSLFLGEPLIKVNYICKSSGTNEGSSRSSLDVVFNSLDLVANQETIVELLAFFNEVMPQGSLAVMSKGGSNVSETEDAQPSLSSTDNKAGEEMVVQAEFRKLNVLLHRPDVPQSGSRSELARSETSVIKVAIINMTGARIEAALSNGTLYTVEAELGGLQIADLSPGSLHTHVFAFGNMNSDQISLMDQTIPAHMYQVKEGRYIPAHMYQLLCPNLAILSDIWSNGDGLLREY
ncbi:intermembrane lipid transfer protein VPS13D-like [Watersipora subatra]|uniref:intermembrane lipid transfer protein VPS13D-like n=1 Tax=Watersipora subatra TaxID=2589382 RepID=UPI00355ACE94